MNDLTLIAVAFSSLLCRLFLGKPNFFSSNFENVSDMSSCQRRLSELGFLYAVFRFLSAAMGHGAAFSNRRSPTNDHGVQTSAGGQGYGRGRGHRGGGGYRDAERFPQSYSSNFGYRPQQDHQRSRPPRGINF